MPLTPVSPPTVLAVGDFERDEFSGAVDVLRASTSLVTLADIDEALAWLATRDESPDAAPPELIVIAQDYPGQFTAAMIDRLRQAAPLVRIVSLRGTWCDGESRTGNPWPADVSASWHEWPARLFSDLARRKSGLSPAWGLPITATDDERLLAARLFTARRGESPQRRGLVAIDSRSPEMSGWLAEACGALGYASIGLDAGMRQRITGIDAAIWDGACGDEHETDRLRVLVAALAPVPVVTLLDFPRVEDYHRVRAAGAAVVLSKPLLLADLEQALEMVVTRVEA